MKKKNKMMMMKKKKMTTIMIELKRMGKQDFPRVGCELGFASVYILLLLCNNFSFLSFFSFVASI